MADTRSLREVARVYDIVTVLGLQPGKKQWVCPFPQHSHGASPTPSLGIKVMDDGVQRFHCFGTCGLQGDALDAVGYLRIPGYDPKNGDHVMMARALLTGGWQPLDVAISKPERAYLDPLLWQQYLPVGEAVIRYALEERGLALATLEKFKVGQHKNAMAIPVFEGGILRAVKYRATWKSGKLRYWSEAGSGKALFNYDAVNFTDKPVLVVKGEIPVMLLDQYGILACCETNGEATDMSEWAPNLAFAAKRVYVTDNDEKPETRQKIWAKANARAHALNAELERPPDWAKDIDQWVLKEPEVAIPIIRSWLF